MQTNVTNHPEGLPNAHDNGGENTTTAESVSSGPASKLTLNKVKRLKDWKDIYQTAQDFLFGYLLLYHGFPDPKLLHFEANEAYNEAISRYNELHPSSQLDDDLGKSNYVVHKPSH